MDNNETFNEIRRLNDAASLLFGESQNLRLKYQKEEEIDFTEMNRRYSEYFDKKE